MRKFQIFLILLGGFLLAGLYMEQKYGVVSAYLKGDMSEAERQEYVLELHDKMCEKQKYITLVYRGSKAEMQEFVQDSINEVFLIDDPKTSSDYDYMHFVHKASHINMSGVGNVYTVTYEMEYLENDEQTKKVDKRIKKIIKDIIKKDMSDYEKIKAVHDYIVDHVEYDTSTSYNTPYYALVEGTSACQGYATLLYKMMTEVGIPCRVITGNAKGQLHAWNLVKLGKKWYNIDATWDDPVGAFGKTSVRYRYFLKSDADLSDHVRDEEYTNVEFTNAYPVALKSY